MIFRWFAPTSRQLTIPCLYGAIVAQARLPVFYRVYGVPDTVTGRLEMIMLHLILVLRCLQQLDGSSCDLGQALFDHFCSDMDDNMREMGVGDLAVPRKMRRIGDAFYARQALYRRALAEAADEEMSAALARHVYGGRAEASSAMRLADYSRRIVDALLGQTQLDRGEIRFPDPEEAHAPAKA